jgi:beta-N-acetylhexosaminidase
MKALLWWGLGLALAFAGANFNDPYLVPARGWSMPALIGAGLVGLALLLRSGAPRTIGRRLLVALWILVPLSAPAAEGLFQLRKARVLAANGPQVAELGRHVMVGYTRFDEVAVLASRGYIGGILVSRRNLAGRSVEDLHEEITGLQAIRRLSGLPPLRVAADQEGGVVSNLSP